MVISVTRNTVMAKTSLLSADHFHDEAAALAFIEARIWPNGPVCPRCGETVRVGRMGGKSTKLGMCKCYVCRKPFAATVGTVMESSHIPLHVWLQAMPPVGGGPAPAANRSQGDAECEAGVGNW